MNEPRLWQPLLDFLVAHDSFLWSEKSRTTSQRAEMGQNFSEGEWNGWRIDPVIGGHNNRLIRATHAAFGEFAIKFTLRDERNRARREFQTLDLLKRAGLNIAPQPLFLDEESYPLPVVVQTWIDGTVCMAPPTDDAEWTNLLAHYQTIHSVGPDPGTRELPNAVLTAYTQEQARALIHGELALIPESAHPQLMGKLLNRVMEHAALEWNDGPISLCRGDGNIRNFLRQPEQWVSVDWEYSGWGDPAFEIAELLAHPAYLDVSNSRKQWVIAEYGKHSADAEMVSRIQIYYHHMLVWWCARFARYRYELPRGLDERLAERAKNATADLETKLQHYLNLAENLDLHT